MKKVCSLAAGERIFSADGLGDVSMKVAVNVPELGRDIRARLQRGSGEMLMRWRPVRALF